LKVGVTVAPTVTSKNPVNVTTHEHAELTTAALTVNAVPGEVDTPNNGLLAELLLLNGTVRTLPGIQKVPL
jgi:hypothetical protein